MTKPVAIAMCWSGTVPRDRKNVPRKLGHMMCRRAEWWSWLGPLFSLSRCVLPRFQGIPKVRRGTSIIAGFVTLWRDLEGTSSRIASAAHATGKPIPVVGARLSDVSVFFVSPSTGQQCSSHRLRKSFPVHHSESSLSSASGWRVYL
jgi:hypothetical protein